MEVSHRYIRYNGDIFYHYLEIRAGSMFIAIRLSHFISSSGGFEVDWGIYSADSPYMITKKFSNQKLAHRIEDLFVRGFYRSIHVSNFVSIDSFLSSVLGDDEDYRLESFGVIQKWDGVKISKDAWFNRIIPSLSVFCAKYRNGEVVMVWDQRENEFNSLHSSEDVIDLFTRIYKEDESLP